MAEVDVYGMAMQMGARTAATAVLVLGLAALVGGCAHAQLRCPRQHGPEWRQYQSPHFDVTTDLAPGRARSLITRFERLYRSLLEIGDWHLVAPPGTDGFYRPESVAAGAMVVIDNNGVQPPGEVFLHELTHRLVDYYVPNTPRALNEGLAEYWSTFVVRDGVARTGLPSHLVVESGRASRKTVIRLPHLQQLLAVDSPQELSDTKKSLIYVAGWFVVHTMARFYPGQLAKIMARMSDGDSFDHAVVATLGPGAWNELGQHYEQVVYDAYHRVPGQVTVASWSKPYRPADVAVTINEAPPIGDAELHLLWADLQLGSHDVAPQIALAAAHGGDSPQLAFMRGIRDVVRGDVASAERELATAVAGRPDNERYHLALARAFWQAAGKRSAQAPAAMAQQMDWLAKHAQMPQSLALVAVYCALYTGDLSTGRARVQQALEIDPTYGAAYFARAALDAAAGDFDDAQRAQRLAPEESLDLSMTGVVQKLRALRARRDRHPIMSR